MSRRAPTRALSAPAAALALVACVAACAAASADDVPAVRADHPRRGNVSEQVAVRGTVALRPSEMAALSAVDAQPIEWVGVEPGSPVEAGRVIVRIRQDPAPRFARDKARIARELAELTARRATRLVEAGVAPVARRDDAVAALEIARADERLAEEALEYATRTHALASPITGVATAVDAVVGGVTDPARPLVRISRGEAFVVRALVPQAEADRMRPGMRARLRAPEAALELAGAVDLVGAAVDDSQRVEVRIALDGPPKGLREGAYVDGAVVVVERANALLVPPETVHRDEDGAHVFVVRDGHAALVHIVTGLGSSEGLEVTDGLAADDLVVVEGGGSLTPGTEVRLLAPKAGGS